ncbi:MAG: hypothetical protein JNM62_13790 [Flavobacteriales bacterium]|nr:hypothetical protein [Flavobacteriales bacterium]
MRISTSLLMACLCGSTAAQHCGYDFAAIIVVHPHLAGDTSVIDGLRITLLDSNNVPLVHQGRPWHLFRRNADYEACYKWQGGFSMGKLVCFPFAKDNYVLVIPDGYDTGTLKLLVQDERPRTHVDIRRRHWPKRYRQQVVPLSTFDNYSLCGTYDDEVYRSQGDRPTYHPVDVILSEP